MKSFSESYKKAGVDVTAGYKAVELMKVHVQKTITDGVISGIGGFGGLFEPDLTGIKTCICFRYRRRRHQIKNCFFNGQA